MPGSPSCHHGLRAALWPGMSMHSPLCNPPGNATAKRSHADCAGCDAAESMHAKKACIGPAARGHAQPQQAGQPGSTHQRQSHAEAAAAAGASSHSAAQERPTHAGGEHEPTGLAAVVPSRSAAPRGSSPTEQLHAGHKRQRDVFAPSAPDDDAGSGGLGHGRWRSPPRLYGRKQPLLPGSNRPAADPDPQESPLELASQPRCVGVASPGAAARPQQPPQQQQHAGEQQQSSSGGDPGVECHQLFGGLALAGTSHRSNPVWGASADRPRPSAPQLVQPQAGNRGGGFLFREFQRVCNA